MAKKTINANKTTTRKKAGSTKRSPEELDAKDLSSASGGLNLVPPGGLITVFKKLTGTYKPGVPEKPQKPAGVNKPLPPLPSGHVFDHGGTVSSDPFPGRPTPSRRHST
jgi:hypothetical protein